MGRHPLWKIAQMPMRPNEGAAWKAGMFRKDGALIGVQFDERLSFEEASLILQQFAGIVTPAGLDQAMTPLVP